jgi:hypothetical protein
MRLDRESVLKLFCYCREAERSVHHALDAPWPDFQAYYAPDKTEAIESLIGQLSVGLTPGGTGLVPAESSEGHGMAPWRFFFRYWFGRLIAPWERSWTFPERDVRHILATLTSLLRLLDVPARPDAHALIALRMAFYDCQRIIEGRCYGLRELEQARRIDHFHRTREQPVVQLADILRECA